MAVMETLGFAAFFGDRVVAAVGGAAMLPLAAAGVAGIGPWLSRRRRRRRRRRRPGRRHPPRRRRPARRRARAQRRHRRQAGGRAPRRLHVRHRAVAADAARTCSTSCSASPARRSPTSVDLVRLDPQFRYRWPDGSALVVPDDPTRRPTAFEAFAPGAGAAWRRFDERGRRIWEVSERTFLAGPMAGPLGARCAGCARPRDLLAIDPLRTLHRWRAGALRRPPPRAVGRALRHLLGLVAVPGAGDAGLHPARRGALRLLVPARRARRAARGARSASPSRLGVEVRTGVEVVRDRRGRRRRHRRRAGRRRRRSAPPVVVANADAEHLYGDLLPDRRALRRVRRAGRSTSGFVVLAAVRGRDAGHRPPQRVVLRRRPRRVRRRSTPGGWPTTRRSTPASRRSPTRRRRRRATRTGSCSSTRRPGIALDARRRARPRARRARRARRRPARPARVDGRRSRRSTSPARYRAPGGAIYGTSSNGRRAAFLRPAQPRRRARPVPRRRLQPPRRRPAARR